MADAVREKGLEVSDLWNESFLIDPNDINPSTKFHSGIVARRIEGSGRSRYSGNDGVVQC